MKHVKKFEHFTGFDLGRFSEEEGSGPEFTEIENVEDTEDCVPCGTEESDEDEDDFTQTDDSEDEINMRRKVWGDEVTVERIATFRQFEAKKNAKKPTTKEKELAAKYPPKDKITKGDFIAAAIENKKKGKEDNKDKEDKKEDKKPKFGSKEWQEKYGKKKK
jgi:hypothetical protein